VDAVRRAVVAVLAGAGLLLAGCGSGSSVRSVVESAFDEVRVSGDTAYFRSVYPAEQAVDTIVGSVAPAARATDAKATYLRYDDDIVVVEPVGTSSAIRVEDLDDGYRNGQYRHLGSGFDPGSPAGYTDDDDVK
jgi:hypothetical protein